MPALEDEDSDYHELYQTVRDDAFICDFCAGAFGVEDAVADSGLVTLDDHDGHPSIRSLVAPCSVVRLWTRLGRTTLDVVDDSLIGSRVRHSR